MELPAYSTVYRSLQPGRSRLDVELLVDIAGALLGNSLKAAEWRQTWRDVTNAASDGSVVTVADSFPRDLATFTGRGLEVARLLEAVDGTDAAGHAPVISVIEGMAGVGKTTLAVRVAHLLARHRQVGEVRLWADLRGYDVQRSPADPSAVLDGFLRQLGVPGGQLHQLSLDRRMARYRRLLAGRRAVIVLDNAATEDQVRPLLPNAPGCLVLITSRRRLVRLAGARRVRLEAFTPDESMDLLRRQVGAESVDADADSASRIAELVGHLPLALAVVASQIRSRSGWALRDHAARLVERKKNLRVEDEMEVAIGLSYEDLPDESRSLLRLLAIHPGRDIDSRACAALAGTDHARAAGWLDSLVADNLVQRREVDRFGLHDLVRVFAASVARDVDAESARVAALRRLFAYYRHAAAVAMDHYAPHERERRPDVSATDTPPPEFTQRAAAIVWLDAERPNLLASAIHADESGWTEHAATLSLLLSRYLHDSAHYGDAELLHGIAIRSSDELTVAHARRNLGAACVRTDRHAESVTHFKRALEMFDRMGDRSNWARVLNNLGNSYHRLGDYQEALSCHRHSLRVFEATGERAGEARALGNVGIMCRLIGRTEEAKRRLEQALAITREIGDRAGEGQITGNLGLVYEAESRYDEAVACYRRYVDISREVGYAVGEIEALCCLGSGLGRLRRYDEALEHYEKALTLARQGDIGELELQRLNGLGTLLHSMGRPAAALSTHREALSLAEELEDRYHQAQAYDGIAQCQLAEGDITSATEHWRRALELHTEVGTPQAGVISERLDRAARMTP
ncbi:ATP-binding protein [Actinophytocola sp.]|uniref:ATP-binding protein n=1 Tax=Actinophytocola sp. TaxID=1872138 RepID=UPI003D6A9BE1